MADNEVNESGTLTESERFTHLVDAFAPGATLLDHSPLTGGVSAQTTALEIHYASGETQRFVVRQHGARDLARDPDIARHEFQLLQALHSASLPVPEPVHVHSPDDVCDKAAVVIEFIEGDIITASASETPANLVPDMALWLARIHDFDLESADLSFLVTNDYHAAHRFQPEPDDSALVRKMCRVLDEAGPVEFHNPPVLLHGDFWRGNLLWKNGELVGILDWEDAMIGDPIIDLARSRLELYWTHGHIACEQFTSHYLSHRPIDVRTLGFWDLAMALGFARAIPGWGLPQEREREMLEELEKFVHEAMGRLEGTGSLRGRS